GHRHQAGGGLQGQSAPALRVPVGHPVGGGPEQGPQAGRVRRRPVLISILFQSKGSLRKGFLLQRPCFFPGSPECLPSPGGPLAQREHRFLCKESGGKESPEGGYPPLDSPQSASRSSFFCGGISLAWRGQFQAFRLSGKRCTPAIWAAPLKGRPF